MAEEIDAWIDGLDPADLRDAVHMRRIAAARHALDQAQAELVAAVKAARDAGDSWAVIGVGLDTSALKAQERYED